jgi:flagellar protein FlbT
MGGTLGFSGAISAALCLTLRERKTPNRKAFVNPVALGSLASNVPSRKGGAPETRPMPLKLSLKPGEKFVLNGAVLTNGDKRASLVIQNKACVLREKDIMQPHEATTPARRIYVPIMMMYLDPDAMEQYYNEFALRMTEFMGAIQNRQMLASCIEISRDVMAGAYYKALISCRKLFDYEQECLNYDPESLPRHATGN